MSDAVLVQLITTGGVVIVALMQLATNRKLKVVGKDAAEAREQTKNTHETNLRHDLDEVKDKVNGLDQAVEKATTAAERAGAAATSAARTVRTVEGYVRDVDASVRSVRHSLDRQVSIIQDRLNVTEDSIPETVRAILAQRANPERRDNDNRKT